MLSIRRLYLYAVAFISLEAIIWGTTGLLRSLAAGSLSGQNTQQFAASAAFLLAAAPVFILHWYLAQREVRRSPAERAARTRAVFLYGLLLATLIPTMQNGLALLDRELIVAFGGEATQAVLGSGQTQLDNLVAILVNGVAAVTFFLVLRRDWETSEAENLHGQAFSDTRRLYRYLWIVYSLAYLVFGAQQIVLFLLQQAESNPLEYALLANGLALLIFGLPVWYIAQHQVARAGNSFRSPGERLSLTRLSILYAVTFLSVGAVMVSAHIVLKTALGAALGDVINLAGFIQKTDLAISTGIPMALVWAYYGSRLLRETRPVSAARLSSEITVLGEAQLQQRLRLRRVYIYGLALLGLVATTLGLLALLAFLMSLVLQHGLIWGATLRFSLSSALAALLVGLPLWIYAWRSAEREARSDGELGDRARRSTLRRGYLFLVLFVSIVTGMVSAGMLIYQLLQTALGQAPAGSIYTLLQPARYLIVFALIFAYHLATLRRDARLASRSLARRYAQFPVLVLIPDEINRTSGQMVDSNFANQIIAALQNRLPDLPVAAHPYSQGVPNETLSSARAAILPAELVARPGEAWRLWLQAYQGERLVIPTNVAGWKWVTGSEHSLATLADQAAETVRRMAEGEDITPPRAHAIGMGIVYTFAVLFAIELILALAALFINLFYF